MDGWTLASTGSSLIKVRLHRGGGGARTLLVGSPRLQSGERSLAQHHCAGLVMAELGIVVGRWTSSVVATCVCWSLNYPAYTYVIARSPSPHASHKPGAHGRSRSPGAQLHVLWAAIIRRRRVDALAVGSRGRHRRIALANCCVSKTGYVRALFRHLDCLCDNHHVAIPPTTYGSIALPRVSSSD
ncbi:hypothetical protein BGZ61DRAFT_136722 [Ilyonectria robusta]|uniref:uncharacterized protein n=1 Tax=Ilyonectria robusta TaxID=1079257 RepID=UPI001E8D9487|nr:uncharacterized protein BGZ61DRAFT_136722 [Ilyonectria robusta]KAH8735192.1 hypothetical protein BGZ61DRAFT_136722 [Ilyonectria robusta]